MRYVITSWQITARSVEALETPELAHIEGRIGGLRAWFLTRFKLSPTLSLRLLPSHLEAHETSIVGTQALSIPFNRMCASKVGIRYPWRAAVALFCAGILIAGAAATWSWRYVDTSTAKANVRAVRQGERLLIAHQGAVAEWNSREGSSLVAHRNAIREWRRTQPQSVDWNFKFNDFGFEGRYGTVRCSQAPRDMAAEVARLAPLADNGENPLCLTALRDRIIERTGGLVLLDNWRSWDEAYSRPTTVAPDVPMPVYTPSTPAPLMNQAGPLVEDETWQRRDPQIPGARIVLRCGPVPRGGATMGTVVGANPYSTGSAMCPAALHAGLITEAGGDSIVFFATTPVAVSGSQANGVTSTGSTSPSDVFHVEPLSGLHVEYLRPWTRNEHLALAIGMWFCGLIASFVLALVYFVLNRALYIEVVENGGRKHLFNFRPSVISQQRMDHGRFLELERVLSQLVVAARATG